MIEFALLIGGVVLILLGLLVRHHGIRWLSSKAGKRILFGLLLAPFAALLISSLGGCQSVDVFAGIESTKNLSPQCDPGGASDRLTSNLGFSGCTIIPGDGKTRACIVYRHHSCAIGQDRNSYDAGGIVVMRRVWGD